MPNVVSYFSRFTVKFIEISAAGVATAVSGYLIAHLGGFLSAPPPAPATVQAAPSAAGVSTKARAHAAASTEANEHRPAATEANEHRPAAEANAHHAAAAADTVPPAAPPARITATAQMAPSHKHATTEASAAESKARDLESVELQVRAALANVDASRPAPADVPAHQADNPPGPSVAAAPPQPQPLDNPSTTGTVTAVTPAAEMAPQPAQQPPAQPDPIAAVEIKSRPIAAVEALPPPEPAPAEEETGLI